MDHLIDVLGQSADDGVTIAPDIRLAQASLEVGSGLTIVTYWDVEGAIEYITMDLDGWSAVMTLQVGETMSHEQGVELIRRLVH